MGAVWVSHDRTPVPCKEWRPESRRSRGPAWETRRVVIPPDGSGIGMQQTSNTSFTAAGIPGAGFLPGERLGINLGRDPNPSLSFPARTLATPTRILKVVAGEGFGRGHSCRRRGWVLACARDRKGHRFVCGVNLGRAREVSASGNAWEKRPRQRRGRNGGGGHDRQDVRHQPRPISFNRSWIAGRSQNDTEPSASPQRNCWRASSTKNEALASE